MRKYASIDTAQLFVTEGNEISVYIFYVVSERFGMPLHAIHRRGNPSADFIQLIFKEREIVEALTKDLLAKDLDKHIPLEYLYRNPTSVTSALLIHDKYYEYFKTRSEKYMVDTVKALSIVKVVIRKYAWSQSINKSD